MMLEMLVDSGEDKDAIEPKGVGGTEVTENVGKRIGSRMRGDRRGRCGVEGCDAAAA